MSLETRFPHAGNNYSTTYITEVKGWRAMPYWALVRGGGQILHVNRQLSKSPQTTPWVGPVDGPSATQVLISRFTVLPTRKSLNKQFGQHHACSRADKYPLLYRVSRSTRHGTLRWWQHKCDAHYGSCRRTTTKRIQQKNIRK